MSENTQSTILATMDDDHVYRRTNARMFRSGFIEAFSKVHPAIPALIFFPVVGWYGWRAVTEQGLVVAVATFLLGVFFWSFTEYTLHRFYFHMTPTNALKRFLYFYSHGIHHAYPDDYYRLVMVPAVSVPLALLFYALFAAVLPAGYVPGAFAGLVLGYLHYDYVHFATHHVKPPRAAWLAPVAAVMKGPRRRHMKHHFEVHDTGYGVSTVFWDHVFGTVARDEKRTAKPAAV
jgi:sterol desaturase/sphingolipid hydroxylase (fatty acid hydroxylase superfamily)